VKKRTASGEIEMFLISPLLPIFSTCLLLKNIFTRPAFPTVTLKFFIDAKFKLILG
jgi:hypothetical protein